MAESAAAILLQIRNHPKVTYPVAGGGYACTFCENGTDDRHDSDCPQTAIAEWVAASGPLIEWRTVGYSAGGTRFETQPLEGPGGKARAEALILAWKAIDAVAPDQGWGYELQIRRDGGPWEPVEP